MACYITMRCRQCTPERERDLHFDSEIPIYSELRRVSLLAAQLLSDGLKETLASRGQAFKNLVGQLYLEYEGPIIWIERALGEDKLIYLDVIFLCRLFIINCRLLGESW
jgi:hypothetical protein